MNTWIRCEFLAKLHHEYFVPYTPAYLVLNHRQSGKEEGGLGRIHSKGAQSQSN